MTEIHDVNRPEDHDWTIDGEVLYSGVVHSDTGEVFQEYGSVSMDELYSANGLLAQLASELSQSYPSQEKIDAFMDEIEKLAMQIGDEAPVIKEALLQISDLKGEDLAIIKDKCPDLCHDAQIIITLIKPPLTEVLLEQFVIGGLGYQEEITNGISEDLETTRDVEDALGQINKCLADPNCTLSDFEEAVRELERLSQELDGNSSFENLKQNVDSVIDDMNEYFLNGVNTDSALQKRIKGFQAGTLMDNGDVHKDLDKEAPHDLVSSSITTNLQQASTTASQVSNIGIQDYEKALSDTKRMIEIIQSMITELHNTTSKIINKI